MSERKTAMRFHLTDMPPLDKESTEETLRKLKEHGLDVEYDGLKDAKECYDLANRALYASIGALIFATVAAVVALIKTF